MVDKRYKALDLQTQAEIRRNLINNILTHPGKPLHVTIKTIRNELRLTIAEYAKLAKVSARTLQDIETEKSTGTVQTINKLLGVLGLGLHVGKR